MNKGYHYTSWDNWLKIREEGLKCYPMVKPEFKPLQDEGILPDPMYGIWLWPGEPTGLAHFGNLVFQMSSKGATKIVKMAVDYRDDEIMTTTDGRVVRLYHDGNISNETNGGHLRYHSGEKGLIIAYDLDISRIELLKIYDLEDIAN